MQVSQFLDQKIEENNQTIHAMLAENELLKRQKEEKKEGMKAWVDYRFESSSGLTEEFAQFARDFKRELTKMVKGKWELVNWSRGHFEVSGFLKNRATGKYVYFSTSDARYFLNGWYKTILIRTAEHDKDYTGGSNCYTTFEQLPEAIKRL